MFVCEPMLISDSVDVVVAAVAVAAVVVGVAVEELACAITISVVSS